MADPTVWGNLPKAQDDPTTIEQAIAAAVAAHNDDPTGHMDTGQSIDVHRKNDIIDHPEGSLVGDKFTAEDFVFQPTFESFDNWDKSGATVQAEPGGLKLGTANTTNAIAYMYAGADYGPVSYQPTVVTTFQFPLALSAITNILAYVLAGSNELVNDTPGIGFKFLNGAILGVEAYHSGGSYHENTVSLGTFAANVFALYRLQVDPVAHVATFYINGVQVGTLSLHTDDAGGLALLTYYIKTTTTRFTFLFTSTPYLSLKAI